TGGGGAAWGSSLGSSPDEGGAEGLRRSRTPRERARAALAAAVMFEGLVRGAAGGSGSGGAKLVSRGAESEPGEVSRVGAASEPGEVKRSSRDPPPPPPARRPSSASRRARSSATEWRAGRVASR